MFNPFCGFPIQGHLRRCASALPAARTGAAAEKSGSIRTVAVNQYDGTCRTAAILRA